MLGETFAIPCSGDIRTIFLCYVIKFIFETFLNFPGIAPGCTANCTCQDFASNLIEIGCDYLKIESVPRVLIESMPNIPFRLYVCNRTCLDCTTNQGLFTRSRPDNHMKITCFYFSLLLASFASMRTKGSLDKTFFL